jgi:hypothetical protein
LRQKFDQGSREPAEPIPILFAVERGRESKWQNFAGTTGEKIYERVKTRLVGTKVICGMCDVCCVICAPKIEKRLLL